MSDAKPTKSEITMSSLDRCLIVTIVVLLIVVVILGAVLVAQQNSLSDTCEASACSTSTSRLIDATLSLMDDDALRKRTND